MLPAHPPVYLVELFDLASGGLEWADVSADLALALQAVYWHLLVFDETVIVRVSQDPQQALEGVAFLREDESLLATVTVNWLDRETSDVDEHVTALHNAAKLRDATQLQAALNRLF